MSWQSYLDTSLASSGKVDKGVIASRKGDSIWAATPGFEARPEEIISIANQYDTANAFMATGFHIAGEKYICESHDADGLYGRKGTAGIIIVCTTQAIIISHHPENMDKAAAIAITKSLGKYLKDKGY